MCVCVTSRRFPAAASLRSLAQAADAEASLLLLQEALKSSYGGKTGLTCLFHLFVFSKVVGKSEPPRTFSSVKLQF